MFGRIPPQAIEAEKSVLGSILCDPDLFDEISEVITKDDFYRDDHGEIFAAIEKVNKENSKIDLVTVSDVLKSSGSLDRVGGFEALAAIMDSVPISSNAKHYAKIVHEKYLLRSLIKTSTTIIENCYEGSEVAEDIVQAAEAQILKVNESKSDSMKPIKDVLPGVLDELERRYKNKGQLTGLSTGFKDLDFKLGGLQKGDLIIVAGRPSMGKTSLAENICNYNAINKQIPVAFFSMEMSNQKIMDRILSGFALVDNQKIRLGALEESDWKKISDSIGPISDSKLEIDDTPHLKPSQIFSKCRRMKKKYGELGLIIIDHLTEMWRPMKSKSDVSEYSENIRECKRLAKEMDCPVILLQQIGRQCEARNNKRPMISDLKETGVSEEVADVILLIYRDEYYNPDTNKKNIAEVIIGKGRDCGTGTVELVWLPQYTKFADFEKWRGS